MWIVGEPVAGLAERRVGLRAADVGAHRRDVESGGGIERRDLVRPGRAEQRQQPEHRAPPVAGLPSSGANADVSGRRMRMAEYKSAMLANAPNTRKNSKAQTPDGNPPRDGAAAAAGAGAV